MVSTLVGYLAQSDLYDSSYYDSYYTNDAANEAAAVGVMAFITAYFLFIFATLVFFAICNWKIFTKAGKPGWAAFVPIYNQIVTLEIINKPVWWVVLLFIPFVNIVVNILMSIELSRVFGKSDAFAILLIFLPVVGFPMLAFDKKVQYKGPSAQTYAASAAPSSSVPNNDETSNKSPGSVS